MPATSPRMLATGLVELGTLLDDSGAGSTVRFDGLLTRAGIDPNVLASPNADISLDNYAWLLDEVAKVTSKECLGLEFAASFPIGGTRVLGYLMRNAPDLGTFARLLETYLPIQVDAIRFRLDEGPPPRLEWVVPPTFFAPRRHLIEFLVSLLVLRLRAFFLGPAFRPVATELEYDAPTDIDRYVAIFGRNVAFGQRVNRITLPPGTLARSNPGADPLLFATMRGVADEKLDAIRRTQDGVRSALAVDLVSDLEEYLVRTLGSESVDVGLAARTLRLTERDLHVELRRRGTSFSRELSKVRRRLAERYLRETVAPMSEIALQLGFSELSAFTRAAKSWFGISPSAWRQQQRTAIGVATPVASKRPPADGA